MLKIETKIWPWGDYFIIIMITICKHILNAKHWTLFYLLFSCIILFFLCSRFSVFTAKLIEV